MAAGPVRAINARNGKELSGNLTIACNHWHRLKGLLSQKSTSIAEGLLIRPCRCVHTLGMKFPIDLIFLDKHNAVISAIAVVPPNRFPPIYLGAYSVLELAAGRIAETAPLPGDLIIFENACLASASLSGAKVAAPALSSAIRKHRGHSRKSKSPLSLEARQLLWPAACSLCLHLLLAGAVAAVWQPEPEVVWVSVSTLLGVEQVQVDYRAPKPSDISAAAESGDAKGPAGSEEADGQQSELAHQLDQENSPEAGAHPAQPVPPSETVTIADRAGAGMSAEIPAGVIASHEPATIAKASPPLALARYSSASLGDMPLHVMTASETVPVPPPAAPVLAHSPEGLPSAGRQLQLLVDPDRAKGPSASPSVRAERKPPQVTPGLPASAADDGQIPKTTAVAGKHLPQDTASLLHQGADPKPGDVTAWEQVLSNSQRSERMVGLGKLSAISNRLMEGSAVSFQKLPVTGPLEMVPPRQNARSVSQEGSSPAVTVQHQPMELASVGRALTVPAWVKAPLEKVQESSSRTLLQPEPIFEAPVKGDLELYMTGKEMGANETRIAVLFRPYPRDRHKTAMSRRESKRFKFLSPTIQRTGKDTVQTVIEVASDGVYEFRGGSDADPQEANFAVTIHGTGSRPIVREIGIRKVGNDSYILRILMPEGILWEDDASFDGTIKDSDGIIKFNSETGLTWKEYN